VGADAFTQVPNPDDTSAIPTNKFALVGVDYNIVDWSFMRVIALQAACTGIPDFNRTVLRAGNHPLPLAVKRDASDVVCMAVEGHDWIGIGRFDVIQLDIVVTGGCQVPFVGGDA
jgi:hypothetical protein